jgi:hypothetical protein
MASDSTDSNDFDEREKMLEQLWNRPYAMICFLTYLFALAPGWSTPIATWNFFPNFPAGFVDMMIYSSRNKRLRKKEGLLLLLCRCIATESD